MSVRSGEISPWVRRMVKVSHPVYYGKRRVKLLPLVWVAPAVPFGFLDGAFKIAAQGILQLKQKAENLPSAPWRGFWGLLPQTLLSRATR